ncbi:hypothetical protein WJX72_009747 [[Myrmecia] bisecta]|uniref:Uncharacterized protein n=1 Tax=[Myrmecia] bisecta TaxID=41462 RepID=A0AAW1R8F0_9CHLO
MQLPRQWLPLLIAGSAVLLLIGIVSQDGTSLLQRGTQQAATEQLTRPAGRRLAEASSSAPCHAETLCSSTSCGHAYEHDASKFPFEVRYTKSADDLTTTFTYQVCSTYCKAGDAHCEPLNSFFVRLDTNLVANPAFIKSATPGKLVDACEAEGIGYKWTGSQMGALYNHEPSQGVVCQPFSMTVYHEVDSTTSLWLTDICEQNLELVEETGRKLQPQAALGDIGSCMLSMGLKSGKAGINLLQDKEFLSLASDSHDTARSLIELGFLESPEDRRFLLESPENKFQPYYGGYAPAPKPYYSPQPYAYSPPVYSPTPVRAESVPPPSPTRTPFSPTAPLFGSPPYGYYNALSGGYGISSLFGRRR